MNLTDVKRTEAEKKSEQEKWETPTNGDDYPWGLTLNLDNATIEKLGLGDMDANEEVRVYARAFISSDSIEKRNGGTERRVSLQITHLGVTQSDTDEATAKELYS